MANIFDKTDKGREEIATRKYRLAPRLRMLLVMIDGKHRVKDLLTNVAGLHLDEQSLGELISQGFIHILTESPETRTPNTLAIIKSSIQQAVEASKMPRPFST